MTAAVSANPCPELSALEESPLATAVRDHVAGCAACRLVTAVFDQAAGRLALDDCLRFDALLAARDDGTLGLAGRNLLERHLASCAACREVADTLSPTATAHGDHATLPKIDPAGYALGLEVARGGMGRILAARDLRMGRPVAIKELLGRSPALAARFEREARVTARLQHPGIVPIYEIGRWPDGTPFYSMRMVAGRTLGDAIDATPRLAGRLALLPAVIAASAAVAFAHSQRVIHRDLTPSNVLVGAYGETVVIDWGLAKDLAVEPADSADQPLADPYRSERADTSLTGAGAVLGTAAYMPPEQARALPVDERADVYALGAILYHLLAGAPPYRARSTADLLRQVKAGPPRSIVEVAPGTPRDLVSIVAKAMAPDPDARYPSALELADELERFQAGQLIESHAYSRGELVWRFVRRHRAAVITTTLAVVLLAGFATVAINRVLRSRADARAQVRNLLVEEGRIELVNGNPLRALAFLHAAYEAGEDTASLRFLLASATRDVTSGDGDDFDCDGEIRRFTLSPDGLALAAACRDTARVWSLRDPDGPRRERFQLGPYKSGFDHIAYSPTGRMIATWGEEGTARLWDAADGALVATLPHGAEITFTTFTPDERRVATTGYDGDAIIWAASGAKLRTISISRSLLFPQLYGQLSPNGKHLLTTTILGDGRGWDIDTGAEIGGFNHGSMVLGGEQSHDGARVATCGTDRFARVWNASDGALVKEFAGHTDVVWKCVFSPDGRRLLTTGHDGLANVWDVATGALIARSNHNNVMLFCHFSPDGRRFVTSGVDGVVKIWDANTGGLLASHDTAGGKDAQFTIDGARLITQRGDGRLRIYGLASGPLVGSFTPPPGTSARAISDDGARVALEDADGRVTLWATRAGKPLDHERVHAPIAMHGHLLAGAAGADTVVIDTNNGATLTRIRTASPPGAAAAEVAPVQIDVADAPDGARIAITQGDAVQLYTLDGAVAGRLDGVGVLTGVRMSADGRRLLAGRVGAPPLVWTVGAGTTTLATTRTAVQPLGFALDGARVVALERRPDEPPRVTIWDAATGAEIDAEADRLDTSAEPGVDPAGRFVTTIGADRVVTTWDVRDGSVHSSFVGEGLLQAQIDPAGELLVGIGAQGTAAIVMNARDGRVLARWAIEHAAPMITETSMQPPAGVARWSRDGKLVITRSASIATWSAFNDRDARNVASINAIVKRHLPWRVVDGRLDWIRAHVAGRVSRPHAGRLAGAKIVAEIRTTPDLGAAPVSWESTSTRVHSRAVWTDDDGAFLLDNLFPGQYTLKTIIDGVTVDSRVIRASSTDVEEVLITIDPQRSGRARR